VAQKASSEGMLIEMGATSLLASVTMVAATLAIAF
jgi:hypothetical protein